MRILYKIETLQLCETSYANAKQAPITNSIMQTIASVRVGMQTCERASEMKR